MLPNQPMQHTKPGRSDIEPTFKKENKMLWRLVAVVSLFALALGAAQAQAEGIPKKGSFTGGTGKYAGIKGKNKFQCWNNPAASTGYCKWWVNYEMP
jgi:hypothetical protein